MKQNRKKRKGKFNSESASNSEQSGEESGEDGRGFIGQYDMFGGSNRSGGRMFAPPGLPHSPDIISGQMMKHQMPQLFDHQSLAGAAKMK